MEWQTNKWWQTHKQAQVGLLVLGHNNTGLSFSSISCGIGVTSFTGTLGSLGHEERNNDNGMLPTKP